MNKILFINPFGIGDVLFTTALIRPIKDKIPDSKISYWCNQRVEDIIVSNPHIDKVFALSRGDLKKIYAESFFTGAFRFLCLLYKIKKENFDTAFDFSLDYRYSLIAKFLGIKQRIGYDYKNRGRFLTDKKELTAFSQKHIVEYYLDLLNFIGIKPQKSELELFVPQEAMAKVSSLLNQAGSKQKSFLVGMACGAGASWGSSASFKHWQPLKFAQLADRIISELKAEVLILGDVSEQAIAEVVVSAMKEKAVNLTGKTDLKELAAVMSNLSVFICNDGGPLHMAVALNVPTVSIFGPVDHNVYGPYPPSPKHIVIKKDLECRPCYRQFRAPVCGQDRACLKSISVEEVFANLRKLL